MRIAERLRSGVIGRLNLAPQVVGVNQVFAPRQRREEDNRTSPVEVDADPDRSVFQHAQALGVSHRPERKADDERLHIQAARDHGRGTVVPTAGADGAAGAGTGISTVPTPGPTL